MSQAHATVIEPNLDALATLPAELTQRMQWVLWRGRLTDKGTLDKIPYDPKTNPLRKASTTDASTWGAHLQCLKTLPYALDQWQREAPDQYYGGGIGYVFSAEDPFCGLDFDGCIDLTQNTLEPWVQHLLTRLDSYTEVSVSGTGLHTIVRGALDGPGFEKSGLLGMYDRGRYFTMTGAAFRLDEPIRDCPQLLAALYAIRKPLLDAMTRYGGRCRLLFAGQWRQSCDKNGEAFPSQSEGDLAFCSLLAQCGADASQIDAAMRLSGLYGKKWERQDYRDRTIATAFEGHTRRNGYAPPAYAGEDGQSLPPEDPRIPYGDVWNALALQRQHGAHIRYCAPLGGWLLWSGTHWALDATQQIMTLARQTLTAGLVEAAQTGDQARLQHLSRCFTHSKLTAMLAQASTLPGVAVTADLFDQHPWLLNCTNGTLDLKTGRLRDHCQTDYLTKCLPVAYDAVALCPQWQQFLWRIMGGSQGPEDPERSALEQENRTAADERARALIGFLQRAVGYSLTGSTREQCLFLLYGITKTGKSTFLATIRALLGPYGQQADMASFLDKERDEVRNDLADLAGSRLVCALETQEGRRLAESLIKQLTGGVDLIKARFLFREHFTYKPQFKIFLGTNHKPIIRDTDSAIWERIRLVPFMVQIPKAERDKTLDERLQQELSGILAWAVAGCLEWQRLDGLQEPPQVVEATTGYQHEMDSVSRFLEECCFVDPDNHSVKVRSGELYTVYKEWAGPCAMSLKKFGERLDELKFEKRTSGGIWRLGIGLHAPPVDKKDPR